jgi:hypothetical protein
MEQIGLFCTKPTIASGIIELFGMAFVRKRYLASDNMYVLAIMYSYLDLPVPAE